MSDAQKLIDDVGDLGPLSGQVLRAIRSTPSGWGAR